MTPEYLKAQAMILKAIENKTISLPPKLARRYEKNDYNPRFSLADRDGELICIWSTNRRRGHRLAKDNDIEIASLSNKDVTDGLTVVDKLGKGTSWPEVTRAVMRHFRMRPTD